MNYALMDTLRRPVYRGTSPSSDCGCKGANSPSATGRNVARNTNPAAVCACSVGLGENLAGVSEQPRRFPQIEQVLGDYIQQCLATNTPFYISPELNSDVLTHEDQLGFFAMILAAIASAASAIGSTVAAVAPSIASIAGTVVSLKSLAGQQQIATAANQQLNPQGYNIPNAIGSQVVNGAFGFSNQQLLLLGGGALLLVLLMKKK